MTPRLGGTFEGSSCAAAWLCVFAALAAGCADKQDNQSKANESQAESATGPLAFTDVTERAGLPTPIAVSNPRQILEVKGGGVALFDADLDGDLDLFVPRAATLEQPENGPGARLWANEGDWNFRDATGSLDFKRWGMGVAVGDTDADGDDDIFVACFGRDALIENKGGLAFGERNDIGLDSTAWGMAGAFGDFDLDGDLDLYVTNYLEFDPANPPPPSNFLGVPVFGGPRPLAAQADLLYRNDDGKFVDVTDESGCDRVEPSYGLGVVVLDFDQDGKQDILVGNDSMPNFLFHGVDDLAFEDVGMMSGLATNSDGAAQATMGIAIADVNEDGSPDVFTSNFQSDDNTLHVGRRGFNFHDSTTSFRLAAIGRRFVGWGALFGDFDHDADEDLIVFNGHVYSEDVAAELGTTRAQKPLYYAREGKGFRHLLAADAGDWVSTGLCARGAATGDLDGDFDLDIVVVEVGGAPRLLRNEASLAEGFIVELSGSPGNLHALGARVHVIAGEQRQTRWIYTGGGYQSVGAAMAHFALPPETSTVNVEVNWPDGETQLLSGVEPRGRLLVSRE
ncbi:MAG: hypothetical protein ACI8TQ_000728 [Planctomycetota bacterium]|jgi:hypothetical protein